MRDEDEDDEVAMGSDTYGEAKESIDKVWRKDDETHDITLDSLLQYSRCSNVTTYGARALGRPVLDP